MYDEAQVFPAPEQIDYQKFAQERPLLGWYQISGASVDLTEAAYRSSQVNTNADNRPKPNDLAKLNRAKEVYVPAHSLQYSTGAADLVLLIRDPDLVSAVKAVARSTDSSQHTTAPRIIKGMVRTPSELPDNVRRLLGSSINTQSIILEEYASPSESRAIETMVAGGALILFTAMLWLFIWRRDRKPIFIPDEFITDDMELEEDR
jgi:hypothetical protein